MKLLVNGDGVEVPPAARLDRVVTAVTDAPKGVAVAVNGDIVPRSAWASTTLSDGDRIEILTAAQGG